MNYRKIALKKHEKIKSSSLNSLLDELLALRGILNKEEIEKFLNPSQEDFISPYAFCDMSKAVKRIQKAIDEQEKILVWGDFDCDGVTSSTVLYKALNEIKANVITYIPDRLNEGHGLNTAKLINFVAKEKVKLIITVDCGISNVKEAKLLKSFGVDIIITDHHTTDSELPEAFAIINPQVTGALDSKLSAREIEYLTYNSGSIVAYKLAMALLEKVNNKDLKDELLVIASCGAVADVVPLLGENRAMVYTALELLNTKKEKSQKGIYRLLSKNVNARLINSTDIAFVLAPRINAIGRLANAKLSFEFLNTQEDTKLDIIIEKLDSYNAIRQQKCIETYENVIKELSHNPSEMNNPAIILMNPQWHVGIIGIVAAKIVEKTNKPCFLITVDENKNARCSIRSNDLINVYQVLKENEELLSGFGGHKLAGGCSFEAKNFENVKDAFLKSIKEMIFDKKIDNTLYADVELKSDDVNLEILDTINYLEPFGQNNEQPIFAMFDVTLEDYKVIGKEQNHLKMLFSKDDKKFPAIKWSETNLLIPKGTKCDIAFYPRLNDFNDVKSIQFEIIDIYSPDIKVNNKDFKIYDHRKKTDILEQISQWFSNNELDIGVWAKTISTKEILKNYENIKKRFLEKLEEHRILMLFDYPGSMSELKEIIRFIKPSRLHLMNQKIDENLENYVKQTIGMIKYSTNHLQGGMDITRMAQNLGVSEKFMEITLEILENIGSINLFDVNKAEYLKPFSYSDFKQDSMFELLQEEFDTILEFKKGLLNCDIKEFEQMLEI